MFFGKDRRAINRILVVEDEPLVAFDNEISLTHANYRVVGTVDSYDDAAAIIPRGVIDLIVTDVNLSGDKNGVAVATLAQQHGIPVLFVTGACPPQARHLALGCLAKPYSQRDLLAAIQTMDAILRGAKPPRIPTGLKLFRKTLDDDAA